MDIYKHYSNGITHITDSGQYSGYEPSRTEVILSIVISTDLYTIRINPHAITLSHKYLRIGLTHFRVGRWQYPIEALQGYRGNERKRLEHMHSTLIELLTEHSINSQSIKDWGVVRVLESHADGLAPDQ